VPEYVLGISCWYHDAAACLLEDGRIVAAAQEERFTRRKHDLAFPRNAIDWCLGEVGIRAADLNLVAFYEKPFLKFERLLETYVGTAPKGLPSFLKAMPLWLKQKLWIPSLIEKELGFEGKILFPEHHHSHAASAFYPSPFDEAAIITLDGVGEWGTATWGIGRGNDVHLHSEIHFPHSLGLLYSAFTYFTGFRVNSGEYKLMGLAPYGEPTYVDRIRSELIEVRDDGSFRLNMDYFTYPHGLTMTGKAFEKLFDGPRRLPESPITMREMNLARSIQNVTEEIVLRITSHVHRQTGLSNLCLAGGVALNCVANGRVLREGPFEKLWIQPGAGDSGGAIGAALVAWHSYLEKERVPEVPDGMKGTYLGPAFDHNEITAALDRESIPYTVSESDDDLVHAVARLLAEENVVGWFQGRMEFGPRALGNRSILADPRGRDVQRKVNLKIKYRESFRPFAASVLADRCEEYFGLKSESPYMLLVDTVHGAKLEGVGLERLAQIDSPIPAVTHVDGSCRIQTVHESTNPLYHRLISAFDDLTGCPVLVNTSFNVRGEPIVCTPHDALNCFVSTHMDVLVLGRCIVHKSDVPNADLSILTAEEIAGKYGLD